MREQYPTSTNGTQESQQDDCRAGTRARSMLRTIGRSSVVKNSASAIGTKKSRPMYRVPMIPSIAMTASAVVRMRSGADR